MLSNAYFLAKFRFDTAENEPAKNLQKFAKFANFANPEPLTLLAGLGVPADGEKLRRKAALPESLTSASTTTKLFLNAFLPA